MSLIPTPSQHYDEQARVYGAQSRQERHDDPAIEVRQYNNWIKAVLIDMYCRDGATVLDLGCGKGGDFLKHKSSGVKQYIGGDVSADSLSQFRTRFQRDIDDPSCRTILHTMDFTQRHEIDRALPHSIIWEVVSCQFAAQYAFRDMQTISAFLDNATQRLCPGGVMIMTVPNREAILSASTGHHPFCTVEFPDPIQQPHLYLFSLSQAVKRCPEYLIDINYLQHVAYHEQGLTLMYRSSLRAFESLLDPQYAELKRRMNVPMQLSSDALPVIDLYEVQVWQKTVQVQPNTLPSHSSSTVLTTTTSPSSYINTDTRKMPTSKHTIRIIDHKQPSSETLPVQKHTNKMGVHPDRQQRFSEGRVR